MEGLKSYWKRNGYERLNGSGRRRKGRVEYLSTEGSRKRRFWKINLKPKLKLRKLKLRRFSPKKLLMNMRDAYVNMMLKLANTRVMSSGGGFAGVGFDYGGNGFGVKQFKEYDEKVLVEIYKSMVMGNKGNSPAAPVIC